MDQEQIQPQTHSSWQMQSLSDFGAVLAGAEIDEGQFFILNGPDRGKFIGYNEVAGGMAPEMGVGVELGRIDFIGSGDFYTDYLEGSRDKYWAGIGIGPGLFTFGLGAGVTISSPEGVSGYVIGTSVQFSFGSSTTLSIGYNEGIVTIK